MNKTHFRPMQWQCQKDGCYNEKHRVKFGAFSDIWPGKISMSDVDGIVEIKGNFLLLEWKSVEKELPLWQRIMYERMTVGQRFTVLVVTCDAENMTARSRLLFYGGKQFPKIGRAHV